MSTPEAVAFSVDLEPNKDGTLNGVRDAMEWFDRTVPRGTVFATYRIATELPDLLAELASSHEIGVHVHPREFGHEHDQLAELDHERQRELITTTMAAIKDAVDEQPVSFRAGRHSASRETLAVLDDLGFHVDASVNLRYGQYLPPALREPSEPFKIDGLTELPVTSGRPPVLSRCGLRGLATGPVTATAATLRADRWGCSGSRAVEWLYERSVVFSFYIHPYDATTYHDLVNAGEPCRRRAERLVNRTASKAFQTAVSIEPRTRD
jgi:peptidoglycan/xylan/chitin deacetylase (PgdA/CDA1 family)